jgi:hypothetical protein
MSNDTSLELDHLLRRELRPAFEALGLRPVDRLITTPTARPQLRRLGSDAPPIGDVEVLSLARNPVGVLHWEARASSFATSTSLRRAGRAALPPGTIVQQFAFQKIASNQVVSALAKLDDWLTPKRGLRQWNPANGHLDPFDSTDAAGKRVLLIIHGTFSNCDNVLAGIQAAPNGTSFLRAAAAKYDLVLTFDHPTVGVSPAMNAFDLAALLRPAPKSLDIISHSRGGLVTRWFLEGFIDSGLRTQSRAVLVGSTIGGTSLASPARLRASMDYLANTGAVLGRIANLGSAHPFLAAAGAMMKVFTSVTNFAAKTPMFDAAIALVPGLHGQSLVGNNQEILRLRANTGASATASGIRYFAVRADFQPVDPGWNFLQYFSKPMQRAANWAADLVFDGPNDLVSDVGSMAHLADNVPITDVHDYGTTATVHHTNYFEQRATIDFIARSLS